MISSFSNSSGPEPASDLQRRSRFRVPRHRRKFLSRFSFKSPTRRPFRTGEVRDRKPTNRPEEGLCRREAAAGDVARPNWTKGLNFSAKSGVRLSRTCRNQTKSLSVRSTPDFRLSRRLATPPATQRRSPGKRCLFTFHLKISIVFAKRSKNTQREQQRS